MAKECGKCILILFIQKPIENIVYYLYNTGRGDHMNIFNDLQLTTKTSVYLQIIQHVKRKILNKSVESYTPLPSRRELASYLSINPNTVQKSYKLMEEEGIIRTIGNLKSVIYVDEDIIKRLQKEMIQETVDEFIGNCKECGLPFQRVIAILSERWDT